MYSAIVVFQVFVILALILLILIQPTGDSNTANLTGSSMTGLGGGSSSFFTKLIVIFGIMFIVSNLLLAKLSFFEKKIGEIGQNAINKEEDSDDVLKDK